MRSGYGVTHFCMAECTCQVDMPNSITNLNHPHPYLRHLWFGVAPRIDTIMTCV